MPDWVPCPPVPVSHGSARTRSVEAETCGATKANSARVSGKQPAGLTNPLLRLRLTERIRILFFPVLSHWALITVSSGKIRAPGGSRGSKGSVNEK